MNALSRARAWLAILTLTLCAPGLAGQAKQPEDPAVTQGRNLIAQAKYVEAIETLETRTAEQPEDARAWFLLGRALRGAREFDGASAVFERAAEFELARGPALFQLGCLQARAGETQSCLATLARARESGFSQRPLWLSDPDLAALQTMPEFLALVPPFARGSAAFVEEPRVIHELDGEATGDQYGWVARVVGDVDGDEVLDFAATAPTHSSAGPGAGRVYLHSGRTGEVLWTRDGAAGDGLGMGAAPAGDVDGDGVPDAIFGAPGAGYALVCAGRSGETILTLKGGTAAEGYGRRACGVGDVDGDGHGDLLVGAAQANGVGSASGRVIAHSGKDGSVLFTLEGQTAAENFGSALDAQLEGEGRLIVIGAMGAPEGGRAYVFRVDEGRAELAFTIEPEASSRTLGMYFVSIPGDCDGDGQADVYASDFGDASKGPATGRIVVHSGETGERLFELTGRTAGEGFGTSPSVAGDVDGDGHADLIVGAWQHASAAPSGGQCTLFSGKDGRELWRLTCQEPQDTFGFDAVGLGDVDQDGAIDFLLTSGWSAVHGPKTGRVFVVAGEAGYGDG